MTVAIVCLLAVIAIVLVLGLVVVIARESRREAIEAYIGHTVVLHLREEGASLRGVMVSAERNPRGELVAVGLAKAEYLLKGATSPAIDGRTVVPWPRVDFFQVLHADGDG